MTKPAVLEQIPEMDAFVGMAARATSAAGRSTLEPEPFWRAAALLTPAAAVRVVGDYGHLEDLVGAPLEDLGDILLDQPAAPSGPVAPSATLFPPALDLAASLCGAETTPMDVIGALLWLGPEALAWLRQRLGDARGGDAADRMWKDLWGERPLRRLQFMRYLVSTQRLQS